MVVGALHERLAMDLKSAAFSAPLVVFFTNHAAATPRYIGIELVKSDPQGPGAPLTAWLESTLLGSAAIAVAVFAVTLVCFMMLTGRVNWKLGATVILGCFLLFGSAAIVTGAQSVTALAR